MSVSNMKRTLFILFTSSIAKRNSTIAYIGNFVKFTFIGYWQQKNNAMEGANQAVKRYRQGIIPG